MESRARNSCWQRLLVARCGYTGSRPARTAGRNSSSLARRQGHNHGRAIGHALYCREFRERKCEGGVKIYWLGVCALLSLNAVENPTPNATARGEQLARVYCGTCHLFPEPALLDQQTWVNGALRRMVPLPGV